MNDKAQAMIDELVAACIAFGRQVEPDWQTRIEAAQRELRAYVEGVRAKKLSLSEIKVGKEYLVHGYDEWDTDEETCVFDGFVVARYEGFSDNSYVFVDAYETPYTFCEEEDCLYGVYSLPEVQQ